MYISATAVLASFVAQSIALAGVSKSDKDCPDSWKASNIGGEDTPCCYGGIVAKGANDGFCCVVEKKGLSSRGDKDCSGEKIDFSDDDYSAKVSSASKSMDGSGGSPATASATATDDTSSGDDDADDDDQSDEDSAADSAIPVGLAKVAGALLAGAFVAL